jgi:heme A synthase
MTLVTSKYLKRTKYMELIFRTTLSIAGLINLIPALLAFFPDKISKSYGVVIPNANYELLLRHRAILFGIIGMLMIYSAVVKKHYEIATTVGLISMTSFIILYFIIGKDINSELKKIMIVDIIATVILCIGSVLFLLKSKV